MRWSSVAWACCVLPVFAGCSSARHAASSAAQPPDDVGLHQARRVAEDQFRRDAQAAWDAVSARHPQRAFSEEFRDGFIDGHAELCDRGAACEPPPVPPVPYARYKRFFGRGGGDLVRDYYLGFQYGADTAAAVRGSPPAPAPQASPPKTPDMTPPKPPGANKFDEPRRGSDSPVPLPPPTGSGANRPPLPKPELPVVKPFNPGPGKGGKFAPIPVPTGPEQLPAPFPPLPVTESPGAPLAAPPAREPRPVPIPVLKIPLSPDVGPTLPAAK